jgi:hypothetical protein
MPDDNQVNAGGLMNSSRCTSRLLVLILLQEPVESMGLTSSAQLSFICSKLRASSMTTICKLVNSGHTSVASSQWLGMLSFHQWQFVFISPPYTPHPSRLPTYLQVISYYSTTPVFSGDFLNQRFLSVQTCYANFVSTDKKAFW